MTAVLIIIFLAIAAWAMGNPIKKQEIIEARREIQTKLRAEAEAAKRQDAVNKLNALNERVRARNNDHD